ncbi:MAG: PVC-type heme-binding CxxCH protein, partial [Planctomycetaceae bacterium]
ADRRVDGSYPIVLTGLKHTNVQGLANSMRWGLDGRIHVATSSSGAELKRADRDGAPALVLRGRDFSFDPRIVWHVLDRADLNPRMDWGDKEWNEELKRRTQVWMRFGDDLDEATHIAERVMLELRAEVTAAKTRLRYARPRRPSVRAESGGGQHGMCFDDHFRKFVCQNSDHIQFVCYEDRYAARAPSVVAPRSRRSIAVDGPQAEVFRLSQVEPWRQVRTRLRVAGLVGGPVEGGGRAAGYFTGATGTTIYRGHNWPEEYRGQAFVGDVGSNIVHRKTIEPDGLGFRANRAKEGVEFIASTDNWFRPSQFLNGPDGNLYVLDMYRETIEHPKSLPPQIKRHLDLTSGRDRGRIYRIVSKRTKQKRPRHPGAMTPSRLVALLGSPNAWDRETAARVLFEKQSEQSVEPLRKLVRTGTTLGRLSALRALDNVRLSLDEDSLLVALTDEAAIVREHAVRLAESRMSRWAHVRNAVTSLADDPDLHVRTQVAFSAHKLEDSLVSVVAKILKRDASNEIVRFACVASSTGRAFEVLRELMQDSPFRHSSSGIDALSMLAGLASTEDAAEKVLDRALQLPAKEQVLASRLLEPVSRVAARNPNKQLTQGLTRFAERAAKILASKDETLTSRLAASRQVLLHPDRGRSADELLAVVQPSQPQALQLAALESLGQLRSHRIATQLSEVYKRLTPAVQQAITRTLVSRENWSETLLVAVTDKRLPKHAVTSAQLRALQGSRSKEVRQMATQLAAETKSTPRSKIVAGWQAVLKLRGDAANGRPVFRKNCSKCHRLEGVGEQIGPGLAAIRNRGIDAVLMNILDPNREVNPQYISYAVLTEDGRTVSGMIASETASGITLRDGEKVNVTVPRDEIEEIRSTGLSLMPEGLEKDISKQQMADLLRYLMTVRQ